ncbi:unnamed protein product [Adineta ricciae]|uniref:Uncharacterized protein n=1 Tax=Adineta ricciae TaxID=249248 RepID=A0A813W517_ADIRI|nr:unnamed protein product [Adineta ricciae]
MASRTVIINNNLVPNYRLSAYILICKTLNVAGVLFVAFSCLQQGSVSNDPFWPIRVMCILAVVNLLMELIHFVLNNCLFYTTTSIIIILQGAMYIWTIIIVCCEIVFTIHIAFDAPKSSIVNYSLEYFTCSTILGVVEWLLSLKRFISDWFQVTYMPNYDFAIPYHDPNEKSCSRYRFSPIAEENDVFGSIV